MQVVYLLWLNSSVVQLLSGRIQLRSLPVEAPSPFQVAVQKVSETATILQRFVNLLERLLRLDSARFSLAIRRERQPRAVWFQSDNETGASGYGCLRLSSIFTKSQQTLVVDYLTDYREPDELVLLLKLVLMLSMLLMVLVRRIPMGCQSPDRVLPAQVHRSFPKKWE